MDDSNFFPDNDEKEQASDRLNSLFETRALREELDAPLLVTRHTGPLDAGLGAPWVVELRIQGAPFSARMEVKGRILIGRSDVSAAVYPDLDLTPYGGLEKGVSRQHAAIVAGKDRLLLVDLGSTNGTFVNDQRLHPNKPYRLRHGDDIRVGDILIEVLLNMAPVHENVLQGQPWVRMGTEPPSSGSGQHILIVEHNANMSEALRTILTRLGYQVQIVQEMAEAFYIVSRRLPDVIIVNLEVGNFSGLELCRYIQRLTHKETVPLIIISDHTDRAYVEEIMNAGVDVFLGKPVGVNELVRAISAVTQVPVSHQGRPPDTPDRGASPTHPH